MNLVRKNEQIGKCIPVLPMVKIRHRLPVVWNIASAISTRWPNKIKRISQPEPNVEQVTEYCSSKSNSAKADNAFSESASKTQQSDTVLQKRPDHKWTTKKRLNCNKDVRVTSSSECTTKLILDKSTRFTN